MVAYQYPRLIEHLVLKVKVWKLRLNGVKGFSRVIIGRQLVLVNENLQPEIITLHALMNSPKGDRDSLELHVSR